MQRDGYHIGAGREKNTGREEVMASSPIPVEFEEGGRLTGGGAFRRTGRNGTRGRPRPYASTQGIRRHDFETAPKVVPRGGVVRRLARVPSRKPSPWAGEGGAADAVSG